MFIYELDRTNKKLGGIKLKEPVLQNGMWIIYKNSFKKSMIKNLDEKNIDKIVISSKKAYKNIISKLPEFDKEDRYKTNLISCVMLIAFLENLENKYTLDQITKFYSDGMNNWITRYFCKHSDTYTEKGQEKLSKDAKESYQLKNPYTWKYTYEKGKTVNEYIVKFYTCGICKLMKEYGFEDYIPAMCKYDYDMAKMCNLEFKREYTLAGGGQYCDCYYKRKDK